MDTVINLPKICLKSKNSVFLNTQHTQSFSNHLTILQRLWPSARKLSKNLSPFPPSECKCPSWKEAKLPTMESKESFFKMCLWQDDGVSCLCRVINTHSEGTEPTHPVQDSSHLQGSSSPTNPQYSKASSGYTFSRQFCLILAGLLESLKKKKRGGITNLQYWDAFCFIPCEQFRLWPLDKMLSYLL